MRAFLTACIVLSASLSPAFAEQNDYEAGKAPAALFASNCGMCHHSPRGLGAQMSGSALRSFIGEHYTASTTSANELTRYLLSVNAAAAPRERHAAAPARRR